MAEYSKQDLEYASELRNEIHKEALSIVRKTHPEVAEVVDRHPVEDYFQQSWEYPGRWYTVVAIPYGCKSRKALVNQIVCDTLSGIASEKVRTNTEQLRDTEEPEFSPEDDPFYSILEGYPDLAVEYRIVKGERYCGYESHRKALKTAFKQLGAEWEGDPDKAVGKKIAADKLFSSECRDGKLDYRKAFFEPPYENGYTEEDFARVNGALFPDGTEELEVYEWTTDWSDYFDDGREWWGTLCLTVYDKALDRFAVITASATD